MHIVTEPTASPSTAPASARRRISGDTNGRFYWTVFREGDDFLFTINADGLEVYASRPDFGTAYLAEKAAKLWCEDPVNAPEPAPAVAAAVKSEPPRSCGWDLLLVEERRGTYAINLVNSETGEVGPDDFKGYLASDAALTEARAWAQANPCDGSAAAAAGEAQPSPTETIAEALLEAEASEPPAFIHDEGGEYPPEGNQDATHAALDADAQLRELRRQVAEQARQLKAMKADIREAGAQADEASALLAEIVEDEATLKALKDALKAKKSRFDLITGKMARHVKAVLHGQPTAYQLTFAGDASTREVIGADAAQVADQLPGTVVWPFNGVEHTIDITAQGEGRYRAVFRDHPDVEGFGETATQALEHAKADASIRFEQTDPGSTDKMPDAGPVADGPRRTKRKGPFEGKTTAQVIEVLRTSLQVEQVIERLECTAPQLKRFLKAEGITMSDHLAKDTELPAPPMEKSGKPRGHKRGAQ